MAASDRRAPSGESAPPTTGSGAVGRRKRSDVRYRLPRASQLGFWFAARLLRSYFDIRVHRPDELLIAPTGTRLILAPTHQSILDPWLLMNAFRLDEWRRLIPIRALATQTFAGGFLARIRPLVLLLYRIAGVIVLPPANAGALPVRAKVTGLIEALKRGEAVTIFPEGRIRTADAPPVREFAPGVVYVHRRTGAPVVPIGVWMGRAGGVRPRYSIRIGEPIHIPPELDLAAGAAWLRERTIELYRAAETDGAR